MLVFLQFFSYSKCPFGWNGSRCDQCIRYTGCVHGYCNKPHECLCEPRWGGLQCDIGKFYFRDKSQWSLEVVTPPFFNFSANNDDVALDVLSLNL